VTRIAVFGRTSQILHILMRRQMDLFYTYCNYIPSTIRDITPPRIAVKWIIAVSVGLALQNQK